jgi:ribose transport system ATP-binding protein
MSGSPYQDANGVWPTPNAPTNVLELKNISKVFAGQIALKRVDLSLQMGHVHGLVGQNGCGKSTLIKILAGYHLPESGATGTIDGLSIPFGSGTALHHAGMRFVHQDLGLIDELTVFDNLSLTQGYRGRFWLNLRGEAGRAARSLDRLAPDVSPRNKVGDLSAVDRTLVAICRALGDIESSGAKVLVLDEPTAALPAPEVGRLFEAIHHATSAGIAVLYVSHNTSEILEICDEITVLCDGEVVAQEHSGVSAEHLIKLIVGETLMEIQAEHQQFEFDSADEKLKTEPVLFKTTRLGGLLIEGVDLELRRGEVLGLAGLLGSGREELPYLLGGARRKLYGAIEIDNKMVRSWNSAEALRQGVVFVASDRKRESTVPEMTLQENITLPRISARRLTRWLDARQERRDATTWMELTNVQPPVLDRKIGSFSGGNQQKGVLSRAFRLQPKVLILDEPVQGVDVGNRALIFKAILDGSRNGLSVIVSSSDAEDLATICDRVLVFSRGRVSHELTGEEISVGRITEATSASEMSFGGAA